jgi:hypothetical protein
MYITYGNTPGPSRMTNGGVWKLDTRKGVWNEITPDKPDPQKRAFGYAAVSADAQNPNTLIVSSYHRYDVDNGEDIFRSLDGGATWHQVFKDGGTYDYSLAPYVKATGIHWLFDIEIDPFNSDHAIFTTGYGSYETFDLTDMDSNAPTKWQVMSTGIEETVALDLLSPPKGAHLISAVGDYCGFVHWDLDKPSPEGHLDNPRFGNTTSLAYAEDDPDMIVRVGNVSHHKPGLPIGYSLDGGRTWQPTATTPNQECKLGTVAVSSDGKAWIWSPDPVYSFGRAPQLSPIWLTVDRGSTWTQCQGIPQNTRVVADRVNPNTFYGMDLFGGKLFFSMDGGQHFTEGPLELGVALPRLGNRGDNRGGQDRLYAAPNREGDLWIAAFDGLYRCTDTGKSLVKIDGIQEVHAFGFGKAAPESDYSVLYLVGVNRGVRGVYRSNDTGRTWVRINDDQHQWGLVLQITGDPRIYGRVYVGTHGRGILYGNPKQ